MPVCHAAAAAVVATWPVGIELVCNVLAGGVYLVVAVRVWRRTHRRLPTLLVIGFGFIQLLAPGEGLWRLVVACTALVAVGVGLRRLSPAVPAEDVYRSLFDVNPHPMWVFDEETLRFIAVNDATVRHYGYTRDEFLAMTIREVVPCEDADRLLASGTDVAASGLAWRHRTKAGVIRTIEASFCRTAFAGRSVRLVMGWDLSDRRKAEQALREREELLRNVLAHIPCGVFWKDRASIYLGCNNQVAQDHGLSVPGEVIGRTDYELLSDPAEAERERACDREVIQTAAPLLNVEETRTRPDGTTVTTLASRVPLKDAAGEVVGVVGIYQDVTERKRLEEQLRQAQKMEAIGRLAGGIAHDFNNLLTIILGSTHLLRQVAMSGTDCLQLVDDIHGAADRAAALTRQLLTFSRRQPSCPEVIDLNEVVSKLMGLLRQLLGGIITIRIQTAPVPVLVRIDRGQIEQVVMNLAVNAKDAMPGGGTLTITTAAATISPQGSASLTRLARLTITDTGVGMTEDVKAHIFEPFFTTKDTGKGAGLGLATVYGIVKAAGGTIEVESAPGAGSTFRIGLPWCDAQPSPSAVRAMQNTLAGQPVGQGRTILLVDDEDGIRKLARLTLESQGYQVIEAEGAEAALRMLTADRTIDLLLTDMIMPGMDGQELAIRLRGERPRIGVVFMSGFVPEGLRLDSVPDALFLPKPFTPAELVQVSERAITRSIGNQRRESVVTS